MKEQARTPGTLTTARAAALAGLARAPGARPAGRVLGGVLARVLEERHGHAAAGARPRAVPARRDDGDRAAPSQRRFREPAFDGSPLNLAGWAKRLTGLPPITVGSVGLTREFLRPGGPASITGLTERLDAGEFGLVAPGRILLANPAWVTLAAAGRLDAIADYSKAREDEYN